MKPQINEWIRKKFAVEMTEYIISIISTKAHVCFTTACDAAHDLLYDERLTVDSFLIWFFDHPFSENLRKTIPAIYDFYLGLITGVPTLNQPVVETASEGEIEDFFKIKIELYLN